MVMKPFTFRGLMAPVFTAFNKDESQSINLDIIPSYSKYLADKNIKGILVNGTSGEGMSMSVEERIATTEAWSAACKTNKQCLMVQIGGAPLPDVLQLARHAESCDVDALLCLPELFNKPKTPSELVAYLKQVSEATPRTPLLYYHLPGWTNVNVNMPEFLNEAHQVVRTLVGIKFTSTLLDEGTACLKSGDGSFVIFLGADQVLAGAFTLGFDSAIATTLNMLPEMSQQVQQHIEKHNVTEARRVQNELNETVQAITKNGSWVPTMKAAMNILTPIQVGLPRPPLKTLSTYEIKSMLDDLATLQVF